MSETPLHQDQECYGVDLRKIDMSQTYESGRLDLRWIMDLYKAYPDQARFFDMSQSKQMGSFDKLVGTENLRKQIIAGASEDEIRKSWEPGLGQYKTMRKKYLIYP